MRKLLIILCVVLVLLPVFAKADPQEPITLMGLSLGMGRQEVKDIIKDEPYSEDDSSVWYIKKVFDVPADLYCVFDKDELISVSAFLVEYYASAELYVDSFNVIDRKMTLNYGTPGTSADYQYYDKSQKTHSEFVGLDIFSGKLTIVTLWEFSNCRIGHVIMGDLQKITHGIVLTLPQD